MKLTACVTVNCPLNAENCAVGQSYWALVSRVIKLNEENDELKDIIKDLEERLKVEYDKRRNRETPTGSTESAQREP